MNNAKKQNELLNFLKGIGCISVVFAHVTFPGETLQNIINTVFFFAVPLFFMVSGYYSYGCIEKKIEIRLKKIINN